MQRREVNAILREADAFIRGFGVPLPPFAHWSPDRMREQGPAIDGMVAAGLGWDITDYGQGHFAAIGLALFTLRNGRLADLQAGRGMCYAEKLLISRRDQVAPMHRHVSKTEDIINRGGARLAVELVASDAAGNPDPRRPVRVACDGMVRTLPAGGVVLLEPGESVTLRPGDWHAFWGEGGDVLIGEVSTVNDDRTDNVFRDPVSRFSHIAEDEPPWRLLVSDYPVWLAAQAGR